MHRLFRHLLLASQAFILGNSLAQAPSSGLPTAPQRSVAVLVDVSGSVSGTYATEAREIIGSLVSGRGFQAGNGWVSNEASPESVDTAGEVEWKEDPELSAIFKPYWDGSPAQKPLITGGKAFLLGRIGNLETTFTSSRIWDMSGPEDFELLLKQEYPATYKDPYTCYYIGVARTADRLLQRSDEGCYLFVVSDEWDDPDTKHPNAEPMRFLNKAGIADVQFGVVMEKRYKELKSNNRFHLIQRFHKGDRPGRNQGSKKYLRVAWYAIGDKPQAVPLVPPKPEVIVEAGRPAPIEPPEPLKAPVFGRQLTLLGGLVAANDPQENAKPDASRIKLFDHASPFFAWQVEGVNVSGTDSQFDVNVQRLTESGTLESVYKLKSSQLYRTSEGRLRGLPVGVSPPPLANGVYKLTIEEKPVIVSESGVASNTAGLLPPAATWIEIKAPFDWMPWALGVSVLGAVGVIGYSVWTLRR